MHGPRKREDLRTQRHGARTLDGRRHQFGIAGDDELLRGICVPDGESFGIRAERSKQLLQRGPGQSDHVTHSPVDRILRKKPLRLEQDIERLPTLQGPRRHECGVGAEAVPRDRVGPESELEFEDVENGDRDGEDPDLCGPVVVERGGALPEERRADFHSGARGDALEEIGNEAIPESQSLPHPGALGKLAGKQPRETERARRVQAAAPCKRESAVCFTRETATSEMGLNS